MNTSMGKTFLIVVLIMTGLTGCSVESSLSEVQLKNGKMFDRKTSKPYSGSIMQYYAENQPKRKSRYRDGLAEGNWSIWYKNGQQKKRLYYRDGKKEGPATSWYPDGTEKEEGRYGRGMKDGVWTKWYPNGVKKEEKSFRSGCC